MTDEDRAPQRQDFWRTLTWLLDERKLSLREMAKQLGRSTHTTFYRWESGQAEPLPEEVFAIERLLGVPPGQLSRHLGYLPPEARNGGDLGRITIEDVLVAHPYMPTEAKEIVRFIFKTYKKGDLR